jgi:hypothetical protein
MRAVPEFSEFSVGALYRTALPGPSALNVVIIIKCAKKHLPPPPVSFSSSLSLCLCSCPPLALPLSSFLLRCSRTLGMKTR